MPKKSNFTNRVDQQKMMDFAKATCLRYVGEKELTTKDTNGISYLITKILSTSQRTLVQPIMISNHNHIHRCYMPLHTGIHIHKVLNSSNLD